MAEIEARPARGRTERGNGFTSFGMAGSHGQRGLREETRRRTLPASGYGFAQAPPERSLGLQQSSNDRVAEIAVDNWKIIRQADGGISTISGVSVTIRQYEPHDFAALYRLDQACFPPGIAYSKTMLRYFLAQDGAECLAAVDGAKIVGFVLSEENPPLAHIITLDVAESHRRHGVGTALVRESEANLRFRGVRTVLLETATTNEAGIAFWERHGYRKEAVLKNYYSGQLDAFEMRKKLIATPRPG